MRSGRKAPLFPAAMEGNVLIPGDQHRSLAGQAAGVAWGCTGRTQLCACGDWVVVTHGNRPQMGQNPWRGELGHRQWPPVLLDYVAREARGATGSTPRRAREAKTATGSLGGSPRPPSAEGWRSTGVENPRQPVLVFVSLGAQDCTHRQCEGRFGVFLGYSSPCAGGDAQLLGLSP